MKKMMKQAAMVTISAEEYETLKAQNEQLQQQVDYLLEQVRMARRRQFGASSEKSEYDQINLFDEAETYAMPLAAEPELCEVEKHVRRKHRTQSDRLPEDLPVEIVEHVLPEEEQVCPVCEKPLHVMGKEVVRRELKLIPAKAVIVEHVRYTYACRNCEKTGTDVPMVKAPMPDSVMKGSFASPEAVAHLMTQKFVLGVPLYRQEQDWARQGILLSRQTMSNWLIRCSKTWLEPIYELLKQQLLARDVLHADETTVQVLREPGKAAQSNSYMWLYRTSGDAEHPIVLYEYQPDRKKQRPMDFLDGYEGYLHTDGYAGYHSLPEEITVVGCWAHARRKFDEALKLVPQGKRGNSGPLTGKQFCDRLFAMEKEWEELPPEERLEKRLELAKPVLDEFSAWLKRQHPTKSAFGQAISYTQGQWVYLSRYLLDGRLEISNNRAERSIKPFVISRKNFLFANTPGGAKSSAIIFSLIETAKENGLNPYEYLRFLLQALPNNKERPLEEFLPGSNRLPKECYSSHAKNEQSMPAWDEF
jgi:transposase